MRRLRQGAQASRAGRLHDLAGFRGRAPPAGTETRSVRRVPRDASLGLENLPGAVVCPVKAGMFSREQTCRGRSQSPVVWIAEEMETEPSKPIDKTSRGEVTSH